MMSSIEKIGFSDYISNVSEAEGVVMLGCGGDLDKWVENITDNLNKHNIVFGTSDEVWEKVFQLETTGGRIDVALVLNLDVHFNPELYAKWLENTDRIIHFDEYGMIFEPHHMTVPNNVSIH